MKQRLSIAVALLHEPTLLILDEPTNGLDPSGIIEIRELLLRLNRERGMTILISSHLLAEIDKLVSHVGVINKGRMVFQGTLEEFKRGQEASRAVVVDVSDPPTSLRIAADLGHNGRIESGRLVLPPLSNEQVALLNRHLVNGGVEVYAIGVVKNDLESVFMELINA
jgi:ABC-2 type transport system ATP-binding protein